MVKNRGKTENKHYAEINFLVMVAPICFLYIIDLVKLLLNFNLDTIEYFYIAFPYNLSELWEVDWAIKDIPITNTCKHCNFTVRNTGANSCERDVIFGCQFGSAQNIIPLLRTLRTTGSKCKFVIVFDKAAQEQITPETRQYAYECGCQFIDLKCNVSRKDYFAFQYVRYYMLHFLEFNCNYPFNRIISLDLHDTVFQGDPFNEQVVVDSLNAADEGDSFIKNPIVIKWSDPIFKMTQEEKRTKFITAAYLGGGYDKMVTFLRLFLMGCHYSYINDQGMYNYIFLRAGKSYGIKRPPQRTNELVYHIHGTELRKEPQDLGEVMSIRNKTFHAAIVHHYYMCSHFMLSIIAACPRENSSYTNYISNVRFSKGFKTDPLFPLYKDYLNPPVE